MNPGPSPAATSTLEDLWRLAADILATIDPGGALPPVVGGGRTDRPALACVFINPTYRNQSTREGWRGPRYPFIGTKPVWRVLAAAGLFPHTLQIEIDRLQTWDEDFAATVYAAVAHEGLYITNLVKRTGPNADLPTPALVTAFRDLLIRELQIVRPAAVVTFGAIPFKALTGESIRLSEELNRARSSGFVRAHAAAELELPVYPCWFPVGRGKPAAAIEMLRLIHRQASASASRPAKSSCRLR
jgi:uracil-DNA glycosylase